MTLDEDVARQRPHSRPVSEIDKDALRERVGRVESGEMSLADVRCVVYAHYVDAVTLEDVRVSAEDLEEGVRALLRLLPERDTSNGLLLAHRVAASGGLHNVAFNDETGLSGWALCGLNLLRDVAPHRLSTIAKSTDDPGHLLEMFVYDHLVPPPHDIAIMDALLECGDPFGVAIVAEKYRQWLEFFVNGDRPFDLQHLLSVRREGAIVVLAKLIARLIRQFTFPPDEGRTSRLIAVSKEVASVCRSLLVAPSDVRVLARASKGILADVLALVFQWTTLDEFQEKAVDELRRCAFEYFLEVFRSNLRVSVGPNAPGSILIGEHLVQPLVAIMQRVGLSPDTFEDLYDGLACDVLSEMTRPELWRADRPRAVLFIAVGALISRRLNNDENNNELLDAVKRTACHAASQPSYGGPLLKHCVAEVTEALGTAPPLS